LRINYDNFFNAVIAFFMILYNEEWHIIMYQHAKALGPVSIIFNIPVTFISLIIVMKLLIAVFLNFFIGNIKDEIIEKDENFIEALKTQIKDKFKNTKNAFTQALYKHIFRISKIIPENNGNPPNNNNIFGNAKMKKKVIELTQNENSERQLILKKQTMADLTPPKRYMTRAFTRKSMQVEPFLKISEHASYNNALFLIPTSSRFSLTFRKFTECKNFEIFISFFILLSTIILIIENPFEPQTTTPWQIIIYIDILITIVYAIEAVLKILACGFVLGSETYLLRDYWNILDFIVFVVSLIGAIPQEDGTLIRSFKVIRAIRFIKIGRRLPSIRVATTAMLAASHNIFRILIFSMCFLIMFGLFGMTFLKNSFYYCVKISEFSEEEMHELIHHKSDCFDYGGDWILSDLHFDNIFSATATLFQVATAEGWMKEMFRAVDAVGKDLQPHLNNNKLWFVYYCIFFFVGNFLVMNMFIAVITETFIDQKNKAS
jgi:hypothetical protein